MRRIFWVEFFKGFLTQDIEEVSDFLWNLTEVFNGKRFLSRETFLLDEIIICLKDLFQKNHLELRISHLFKKVQSHFMPLVSSYTPYNIRKQELF